MNTLRSTATRHISLTVLALLLALPVQARLGTGFYNVYDTVWACLKSDGSWTSPYFAGLGGRWRETSNRLYLYGNYADGAGNDAMTFSNDFPDDATHNPGTWVEWRDDMSWYTVATKAYIYKLDTICPEGTRADAAPRANPLQR